MGFPKVCVADELVCVADELVCVADELVCVADELVCVLLMRSRWLEVLVI